MRGETKSPECDLRRARSNTAHRHRTHIHTSANSTTGFPLSSPAANAGGLHAMMAGKLRLPPSVERESLERETTSPRQRAGAMKMKRSKLVTGVLAFAVLVSAALEAPCARLR